ncbi:MAG: electron transfer flavoprotein subunit beta/FixA family protein [Gammaproteobacteria bacterium]
MKVLVPMKRVIDYNVAIRINADHTGVVTDGVKMGMNPFDAIALEEALRLKENQIVTHVCAVSIGPASQDILRQALALGADEVIWIQTDLMLSPLDVAQVLSKIVNDESFELVLMGKQAIDDDCNQTGQILAGLCNIAQATFASHIAMENQHAMVARETDDGIETIRIALPAVITVDLRLNEPRFASLPQIMKAKSKPMRELPLVQYLETPCDAITCVSVTEPPVRKTGIKVNSAEELVYQLRHVAKVLP